MLFHFELQVGPLTELHVVCYHLPAKYLKLSVLVSLFLEVKSMKLLVLKLEPNIDVQLRTDVKRKLEIYVDVNNANALPLRIASRSVPRTARSPSETGV